MRLLLLLFTYCSLAYAGPLYIKGMKSYKKRDFQKAAKFLGASVKKERDTFKNALLALGRTYWKLGKRKQTYQIYGKYISLLHKKTDADLQREFQTSGEISSDVPDDLLLPYYFIGEYLAYLGFAKKKTDFLKRAKFYYHVCETYGYQDAKASKKIQEIDQFFIDLEQNKFSGDFYLAAGNINWHETVTLQDSSGVQSDILSMAKVLTIGVGYERSNFTWGYKAEVHGLIGNSNVVKLPGAAISQYKQTNVGVTGMLASAGALLKSSQKKAHVGLNVNALYTLTDFTVPANYSLADSPLKIGLGLEAKTELIWGLALTLEVAHYSTMNTIGIKFSY